MKVPCILRLELVGGVSRQIEQVNVVLICCIQEHLRQVSDMVIEDEQHWPLRTNKWHETGQEPLQEQLSVDVS